MILIKNLHIIITVKESKMKFASALVSPPNGVVCRHELTMMSLEYAKQTIIIAVTSQVFPVIDNMREVWQDKVFLNKKAPLNQPQISQTPVSRIDDIPAV
mmetsp:Transcript_8058/g.12324  ORF Transcript_8058/g.12324 Transcript_8058/m.12324 type:complete len:100 (-) Transcript_8058:475-774(-)